MGKHGAMPHLTREGDLPRFKRLAEYYVLAVLGVPDLVGWGMGGGE